MSMITHQEEFLTDLTDELSELVQVALAIRSDAKFPDATVELLSSLKGILKQKHGRLQLSKELAGSYVTVPGDMITQCF